MVSLPLFHPCFKQLDNGFLHSLRCIGAREVFSDFIHRELQIPGFGFLLLCHNAEHGIIAQLTLFGKPLHSLRLGKRRRCLFAVDCLDKELLFIGVKVRNLNRRGHTDLALINHLQKLRFKLGQSDIPLNLSCTIWTVFRNLLSGSLSLIILSNLDRISARSASSPFDGFQLHFVCLGFLTWKDIFSLQVAVYHDDGCGIAVNIPNNERHSF